MSLSSIGDYFKKPETGLLLLRASAGLTMILHGLPKYLGGASVLTEVGKAISVYGITQYPLAWGFAAATVEVFGGLLIVLGVLFRPASFALVCVLLTALISMNPQPTLSAFGNYAHPWIMLSIFLALFFTGPGAYSIGGSGSKSGSKSSAKSASKSEAR